MFVVVLLVALLVVLAWWVVGALFLIPVALVAARWSLPVGALLGLVAATLLLTGLVNGTRLSTPEHAARKLWGDDAGQAPLDYAWPSYFFQQCWFDIHEQIRIVVGRIAQAWRVTWHYIPGFPLWSTALEDAPGRVRSRTVTVALGWPLLSLPAAVLAGATAGALAALVMVTAVTVALSGTGIFVCAVVLGPMVLGARVTQRLRRSTASCTRCFHSAKVPAFKCPEAHPNAAEVTRLHRRLRPGVHGLWWHRCGCGRLLPTTPARIARVLHPLCPHCLDPMHPGAGWATDIRIALLGAPRAGKTALVEMAVDELTAGAEGSASVVSPPGPEPAPDVTTLRFGDRRPTLVHFFHSPGADLIDPASRRELSYLDDASCFLYVLDPISVPAMRTAVGELPGQPYDLADFASVDPVGVFHAVISSLRFVNVNMRSKSLAVVVTKTDVLAAVEKNGIGTSSEAVQQWLTSHGIDGILFSARNDFRRSRFFLSSTQDRAAAIESVRWLLRGERVREVGA